MPMQSTTQNTSAPRFHAPAFVIAMDNEAAAVTAHLEQTSETKEFGRRVIRGWYKGLPVAVYVSGVGKTNAAATAQLALARGADVLINCGVAGGLLPSMKVAELYRVRAAVQYDFDLAAINQTQIGTLNEYKTRELPLARVENRDEPEVILGTGDRFNDSDADFHFLVDDVKASLRDMEGAAFAHVALRANVPCYSFKAVSDVHGSGSTIDQYLANLSRALAALSDAVPSHLDAILF